MATETPYTFITTQVYEIRNPDETSEEPLFAIEAGLCTVGMVNDFTREDFEEKSVISLDEIYCSYTTDNTLSMPYADMTEREELPEEVPNPLYDPEGDPLLPEFSHFTSPWSGDARPEIIASDMRSGLNIGVCPTFGEEIADDSTEIHDNDDTTDLRSVGLRLPSVFAGFGYTTEGFPVPSLYEQKVWADSRYTADVEIEDDEKRRFADNVRKRADIWKAGPIDLRWDEPRKMWVAAPEVVVGYTLSDISAASGRYADKTFTSGELQVSNGRFDDYNVGDNNKILLINRSVSTEMQSGVLVIAVRTNNGEYMPVWVDCAPDEDTRPAPSGVTP